MRTVLVLLFVSLLLTSYSQKYAGKLIDKDSGEPVAFANIGIIDQNIGTVTNTEGWFEIVLEKRFDKDSLRISCIGYTDKSSLIHDFKREFSTGKETRIELTSIAYTLQEVLVRPENTRAYTLGYLCDSNSAYGNAFYSKELGTEMGVVINLPRKENKAYLKTFRFYVGEFTFETFPVRLNIYDMSNGEPGKNILREAVFIEITSTGEYIVDLRKYNITATGNFFVSLEYYRIPDNTEGKLIFCAVHGVRRKKAESYYRWTSQGSWQKEMFDHVGFSVELECAK